MLDDEFKDQLRANFLQYCQSVIRNAYELLDPEADVEVLFETFSFTEITTIMVSLTAKSMDWFLSLTPEQQAKVYRLRDDLHVIGLLMPGNPSGANDEPT